MLSAEAREEGRDRRGQGAGPGSTRPGWRERRGEGGEGKRRGREVLGAGGARGGAGQAREKGGDGRG